MIYADDGEISFLGEVYSLLRDAARDYDSYAEFARVVGVSRSHMTRLLKEEAKPGPKVLEFLELKSIVVYVDYDR